MTNKNEVLVKNQKMGDNVLARVKSLETQGDLKFPENYSPENAMKSAMLTLQDLKGSKKDGYKPALEFANPNSIANALMDMVVQGLNPAKNQGYFIMYGDKVQFQRSYLGTMAVTRRVTGAKEINAEVIFEGDEVKYKTKNGKIVDLEHSQSFGNRDSKKIIGAYATVVFEDESKNYTEIMSFEEIEEAWKQSQMVYDGKFKEDGTHRRFPQEMAKKTVINRACKKLLNSSDDSSLLSSEIKNRDNRQRKEILDAEEEANANKELLEFEEVPHKETTDVTDFEEVEEIKEEPAQQTTEDEEPF
ncbi:MULTISPECIES: recombinase RecT [Mammaliicoccus]|uniref:recombinase RecT n=1 Tax=Mammaliicoccus TaxID=2803850 RepID=UPI00065BAB31|nr:MULTISPECIES: recombinase RecT [Mammaliicoccus]AQN32246.1 recombinational DNA repair protein [Staphylococcus phage phi879]MCD5140423.1 recombinase RecT [Mammaliicoccus sciuri]PNY96163.1 recombinase [Mammaliicoccus sciuri]SQE50911.1 Recombinational DNA repair protein RecT (prophage associated) [Mammaliicoccus sciuri]